MGVGVDDANDFQTMGVEARHDQVRVASGIDDDGFFAEGVADDGAVALERADGECFADEYWVGTDMEKSWTNGAVVGFRILLYVPIQIARSVI